eukprot:scaffold97869_cov28-Tisochrysis_lutea.AAC.3
MRRERERNPFPRRLRLRGRRRRVCLLAAAMEQLPSPSVLKAKKMLLDPYASIALADSEQNNQRVQLELEKVRLRGGRRMSGADCPCLPAARAKRGAVWWRAAAQADSRRAPPSEEDGASTEG